MVNPTKVCVTKGVLAKSRTRIAFAKGLVELSCYTFEKKPISDGSKKNRDNPHDFVGLQNDFCEGKKSKKGDEGPHNKQHCDDGVSLCCVCILFCHGCVPVCSVWLRHFLS